MKRLKIYNSMTHQKEEFVPLIDEGKKDFVGIYTCGPTVYYYPHIGNMKAYMFADVLRHTIRDILGYPTKHVVNITDVGHLVSDCDDGEDKLEKGSKREGISAWDVAKKYENIFIDFLKKMNIELFDYMPRATEYISQQIELVQLLVDKGYTYVIENDGIYFDTSKVEDYGKLLGPNYKKHLEGLNAGERIECVGKKNPTDFALRKFSPKGEKRQMEWDSPWGVGFPGWHIECSAMSRSLLGGNFDLHTGGYDHIPVHHTNEIVQSECGYDIDKPWVKYWMHVVFMNINNVKISKSLGNFFTLLDVIEKGFDPLDFRYFNFHSNYRTSNEFSWDTLTAAKNSRNSFIKKVFTLIKELDYDLNIVDQIYQIKGNYESFSALYIQSQEAQNIFDEIIDCLLDDLNTPGVLSGINKLLTLKSQDSLNIIFYLDKMLLRLDLYKDIIFMLNKEELEGNTEIPLDISDLVRSRQQAKLDKNYTLADQIRNQVENMGYKIVDTKDGYHIKKI